MIKIIALGNLLMKDDGVAVSVLKKIENELVSNENIELIYGETDFAYCLNKINNGDEIIIIDSTYFGIEPGIITVKNEVIVYRPSSQHQINLINMIRQYKSDVSIYFIGIEIGKVEFGEELSDEIISKFEQICDEILKKVLIFMGGIHA